jgi:hypothetical protein
MLTEDLVKKHGMAVYAPRGQAHGAGGGSLVTGGFNDFPKIWQYFYAASNGTPFMTSPGVFDQTYISAMAKQNMVVVRQVPFTNTDHPENRNFVGQIKAINPATKILWYDTLMDRFQFISTVSIWGEEWTLVVGPPDLRFYYTNGDSYPNVNPLDCWVDIGAAKVALLALWRKYGTGADGVFFDFAQGSAGNFSGGPGFARAGYGSKAALDAAQTVGLDYLVDGMKLQGLVYANGADYTSDASKTHWDGQVMESWDRGVQNSTSYNFATFDLAIAQALLSQGSSPTANGGVLTKSEEATFGSAYNVADWRRAERFTLGSATLAGGHGYTGANGDVTDVFNWADEYTVTPAGVTDTAGLPANRGWLGRPKEFAAKDSGSSLWVRRFDRGAVIVNGMTSSHSITMEWPYKRILGSFDPTVNNGATSSSITVPARDAVFLLRT